MSHALPGILTSSALGYLEYSFAWLHDRPLSGVKALPYPIYAVNSKMSQNDFTERVRCGTAIVPRAAVMLIALTSVIPCIRFKW